MPANILQISDETFKTEIINCDIPSIVDFWASWCGPCKAIAPILEEIAEKYIDKIKIAKLNVDEHPKTPSQYGIRAIPTLIIFKNGQAVDQITGVVSKKYIEEAIQKILSK